MASLTTEIGARLRLRDHREYIASLNAAQRAHAHFNAAVDHTSFVSRAASAGLSGLRSGAMALGSTVLSLGTRFVALGAIVAGAAVRMGVGAAIGYEQATVAFTSMLGNADQANQLVKEIERFAIESPFGFPEVLETSRSLKAMGIEASKIIPMMKIIGDASAGLGLGSAGIERIGRALGQINAKGFPSGEEMRQLADAGVTAWKYLAEAQGQSIQKTMAQAERRAISGGDAISAILAGIQKDFGGLTEQIAETTVGGAWEVFADKIRRASRLAVVPFMKDIRGALHAASDAADTLMTWVQIKIPGALRMVKWGYWGKTLTNELDSANKRLYALGRIIGIVFGDGTWQEKLKGVVTWFRMLIDPSNKLGTLWHWLGNVAEDLGTIWSQSIYPAAQQIMAILPPWTSAFWLLGGALSFLADHAEGTRVALLGLMAVYAAYRVLKLYSNGILGISNAMIRARDFARGLAAANALVALSVRTVFTAQTYDRIRLYGMYAMDAVRATRLWAAANWLLATSFYGIPVVWIVLAIAAFVAGIILAYQKVDWFHEAVDRAWQNIQRAWDWIDKNKWLIAAAITVSFGPLGGVLTAVTILIAKWETLKGLIEETTGTKTITVREKHVLTERAEGKDYSGWQGFVRHFIPGFAEGGTVTRTGPILVGENGPELRYEHAGAVIQPIRGGSGAAEGLAKAIDRRGSDGDTFRIVDGHRVLFELVRESVGDEAARR